MFTSVKAVPKLKSLGLSTEPTGIPLGSLLRVVALLCFRTFLSYIALILLLQAVALGTLLRVTADGEGSTAKDAHGGTVKDTISYDLMLLHSFILHINLI